MAARDDEIESEPSAELIERVAERGKQPKRRSHGLKHAMRTALGAQTRRARSITNFDKPHSRARPKPSMPKTPWDDKDPK